MMNCFKYNYIIVLLIEIVMHSSQKHRFYQNNTFSAISGTFKSKTNAKS